MKNLPESPPLPNDHKEKEERKKENPEQVFEIEADERAFNPSKHLDLVREKREQFAESLKSTDLNSLVSMLEISGKKKIEKRKDIPIQWIQKIRAEENVNKGHMFINPKLSFISDEVCTGLVVAELKRRFEENNHRIPTKGR